MQISRGLEKEKERDSGGLCKKLGFVLLKGIFIILLLMLISKEINMLSSSFF
jgi:hypothetical protein